MSKRLITPPESIAELLSRGREIAGITLGELADRLGDAVPDDQRRAKGWVGQQVEAYLGASAASLAEPDFQSIGVELKTLPLGRNGQPRETTYVCTVPLIDNSGITWKNSWVRGKLQRVFWLPLEADPEIPLSQRRIGSALLWDLEPDLENILRADWEELMEMVCLGQLGRITARHGTYLQIRPKAASSRSLCWAIGESGERIRTNPRGFYLRTSFTREILHRHYAVDPGIRP